MLIELARAGFSRIIRKRTAERFNCIYSDDEL
jgi:hypothetical protein